MDSVVRNISGEKEAEELGLCGIPIKLQDKEFAPSTLGHRSPFEYRRVPLLGLSLLGILEARTSK